MRRDRESSEGIGRFFSDNIAGMRWSPRWRPSRRAGRACVVGLVVILAIGFGHGFILRVAGGWLVESDPIRPMEYAILTPETDRAGELEATVLFEQQLVARIAILTPGEDAIDREFRRRGALLPNERVERLLLLGIPSDRLTLIPAGEGDTRDSTSALVSWLAQRPATEAMVITGVTHSRRFKRVLRRKWLGDGPLPLIRATRFDDFRAADWWLRRWTLRGGIVELQKLALDYLAHPF